MVDALCQRYSKTPAELLGYHPRDGRGFLLNLRAAEAALQHESEASHTTKGDISRNRASWNNDKLNELKEKGLIRQYPEE